MKSKLLVFVLLFLFTALSLIIAGVFSPTGLVQKQFSLSIRGAKFDESTRKIETGGHVRHRAAYG